jgi:predicted amino acid-binding ACT domain protein
MRTSLAATVIGNDKPGIVERLSEAGKDRDRA